MSRAVVERAREGDREAFDELARLYVPLVTGAVLARTGRFQDTEDVVQETLLRAFQEIGRLRDPDRFGSWLYGIALNVLREQRRPRPVVASPEIERAQTQAPDSGVRAEGLRECLERLPTALREIFILRHIQGMSYRELGEVRNVSISSVGERLWKARRLLRTCLEKAGMLSLASPGG